MDRLSRLGCKGISLNGLGTLTLITMATLRLAYLSYHLPHAHTALLPTLTAVISHSTVDRIMAHIPVILFYVI